MTTTNILPYQPTSSPPPLSSSPTDRIHGQGKLRSFFESVRQDDSSNPSLSRLGNNGNHKSAHHHHRGGAFGGGPNHVGPGPPPPNLHLEYERIMGKKPMSPRTLHAAEAAALALDPAARMAHNNQQQQRVHTVPSRSSLVKSQFGSSIPNLQSIYPATRSSILASGPGLAGPGPQSAKRKGSRSRSGSNTSSAVGGESRQGPVGSGLQKHSRNPSTDSAAYQQYQAPMPYPTTVPYQQQQQQQQQAPIWMSNSLAPLAPSVVNKIHSAHQSRSNSLNRQPSGPAAGVGPQQGVHPPYPMSAPAPNWQQPYYSPQQQYMMQPYPLDLQQQQQLMMYHPSTSPVPAPAVAPKKSANKAKPPPRPPQQPAIPTPQPQAIGHPQLEQGSGASKRAAHPKGSRSPPPAPPQAAEESPGTQKAPRPPPPEGFVACSNCGRSFAPDRVAKHEAICAKMTSNKRAPVDMSQVRKELIARDNRGGGRKQGGGGFG